jgi:hypothetical protein
VVVSVYSGVPSLRLYLCDRRRQEEETGKEGRGEAWTGGPKGTERARGS